MSTWYLFLFELAVLTIGVVDIPYKKILKVYIWCGIIIMALAMLGALTGAVRNLTYVKINRIVMLLVSAILQILLLMEYICF